MEYQQMANLIDDASNHQIGLKQIMNQEEHTMLIVKSSSKLQY